jgi:hypothetical protein
MDAFRGRYAAHGHNVVIKKTNAKGTVISTVDDVLYAKSKGTDGKKAVPASRDPVKNKSLYGVFASVLASVEPRTFITDASGRSPHDFAREKAYLVNVDGKQQLYAEHELDYAIHGDHNPEFVAAFLENYKGPGLSGGRQSSQSGQSSQSSQSSATRAAKKGRATKKSRAAAKKGGKRTTKRRM